MSKLIRMESEVEGYLRYGSKSDRSEGRVKLGSEREHKVCLRTMRLMARVTVVPNERKVRPPPQSFLPGLPNFERRYSGSLRPIISTLVCLVNLTVSCVASNGPPEMHSACLRSGSGRSNLVMTGLGKRGTP